ncbi:MFS transporter [[Enterobacter] lignolyticus]|uniref:Shikimate transporter n=1 Tax=Enterobacter lignolyticus (strain SCF1) TaxID=701347 RepID=E3G8N4_ENTLS|nr:MFS transporter [[Enterobacter] lignolyticus]ADO47512.1 shikimate transporter [[Enterobacter] lignolyticus SCF1]
MSERLREPSKGLSGKAMRRVVIGSFAGALLEWYDFFIFGTAAGLVFAPLFFPDSDPLIGLIASFATFGVGFLSRPLGGIVFGHFGDKVGRKITLIWTLGIIGTSTFLIGFLPVYKDIGIWAPLLLMLLRLIQGFGLGGEYGGAALMTIESAPEEKRGFLGSLPQMAASVGIMLATGVFTLCDYFLTQEQFLSWGWRIPFWLSAVMLIVGMFIRLHTEETLDFRKRQQSKSQEKASLPLIELFRKHPRNILLATGARLAESVSSNIINAFGIVYISSQLALSRDIPLTGMLIASVVGTLCCPLMGWLSDRFGQRLIYLIGAGFCVLFAFPFFMLLGTKSTLIIWCSMTLGYSLGPTMMFAVQPTMFARMFGTSVRYTGLSFAYQLSAILGGLSPLIASSLLALGDGKPGYVASFLLVISVLSFTCTWLIKPQHLNENVVSTFTDSGFDTRKQPHER